VTRERPLIETHGLSDTGTVREDNQDALRFCRPEDDLAVLHGPLYGIADGMGGLAHGGVASTLALEILFKTFYGNPAAAPLQRLRHGFQAANVGVCQAANRMGVGRMGTTLTAAHLRGSTLSVAHVGDSRAYLIRDHTATCLTSDHTRVGELVRMRLLSPDKVRGHQQRSVLNRCLGLELFVQPDLFALQVRLDDLIVLCTDGVWGVVEDQELAGFARAEPTLEGFNQAVLDRAIRNGSDDNLSLLSLRFRALAETPGAERPGSGLAAFIRGIFRPLKRAAPYTSTMPSTRSFRNA
jgi:protein phosphatase